MNKRRAIRPVPPVGIALAVVAALLLALPVVALFQRAPWSTLWSDITSSSTRTALRLSLVCSFGAAAIATVVGVPLAWVLARVEFRGRAIVRALVLVPLVLPPVVGGVALLLAFGRRGLVGQWLDRWFAVRLPFSTAGALIAEAFVALPFLVLAVEAGIRSTDPRLDDAAASLGASRWTAFRRVTLPAIRPALIAGAALAWARALGEFGATITFAGNFPGKTQTLPLAVYQALETDTGAAIAISVLLLIVSFGVLVALRGRWFGTAR